jgi:hypothetical protein
MLWYSSLKLEGLEGHISEMALCLLINTMLCDDPKELGGEMDDRQRGRVPKHRHTIF